MGTPWGIVTNKPQRLSLAVLERLNLSGRCASLVCPEDLRSGKPDPEGLWLACQQLQQSRPRCVYVGDHRRDIEAGLAAGMITIAAAWGYLPPASGWMSGTAIISPSATQLQHLLNSLLSQAEPPRPG